MSKRRRHRNKLPSEAVTLEISGLSHEGRGIAHIEGKVAFVAGALPGEMVTANYVRNRSQFSELRTASVITPSPERVVPVCDYHSICGGCSLQHWDSTNQLDFKESVLLEHLQNTANLTKDSFTLLPQIKAPTEHYRRKARLAIRKVMKKGGMLVGFREKYSSFITDMNSCKVLAQEVADLIDPLREFIIELEANETIPQIEVAVGEDATGNEENLQVALVIRHLKPLSEKDEQLIIEFAQSKNFDVYFQPAGVESVKKYWPEDANERLYYFLPEFDLKMAFHPMDFTQVNAKINREIVSRAISMLKLDAEDTVLDLFCGLGNFTLPIARNCRKVVGVEGSNEMVLRGAENASANNISNAEFFVADLTKSVETQSWFDQSFSKVLLDPPRSGALEVIPHIAKLGARKIIYISCNPATLARDTAELIRLGYKLKSTGVMDMFPHTTHVESMAEFSLE